MNTITYLSIALLTMEADAYSSIVSGVRYRVVVSAVLSLLWPVTTPLFIAGVITAQQREANRRAKAGKGEK